MFERVGDRSAKVVVELCDYHFLWVGSRQLGHVGMPEGVGRQCP